MDINPDELKEELEEETTQNEENIEKQKERVKRDTRLLIIFVEPRLPWGLYNECDYLRIKGQQDEKNNVSHDSGNVAGSPFRSVQERFP